MLLLVIKFIVALIRRCFAFIHFSYYFVHVFLLPCLLWVFSLSHNSFSCAWYHQKKPFTLLNICSRFFFLLSFILYNRTVRFWWNADASNLVYLFDFVLCIRSILRFSICTGKLDDWHQKRNKAVIDCVNNSCSFFSSVSRSSLIFTRFPVQNENTNKAVYFARLVFFVCLE